MPLCTTTLNTFKAANDSVRQALADGGSLIKLRTEERDLKVIESDNLRQALTKTEQAGVLKEKQARNRGRKQGGIIVAILFIGGKIIYEMVDND